MNSNIVILDGEQVNPGDLSWSPIEKYGNLTIYGTTRNDEIVDRAKNATIVGVNKIRLNKDHFNHLPELRLICVLATGYDNINLKDAAEAGITVCNAVGYSVYAVSQHVFALLLSVYNQIDLHNHSIQNGDWSQRQWSYSLSSLRELKNKTLGIYGFGKIGRRVAEIGMAFGMNILAHHKHPERDATEGVSFVSLESLFENSDVVSLHVPLTEYNHEIVDLRLLQLMKSDGVLINTGRGGLINEEDLKNHLLSNKGFYAALDVLSKEPPEENHPLIGLDNCIITPHNAWASKESRERLIQIVGDNIDAFMKGHPSNTVA